MLNDVQTLGNEMLLAHGLNGWTFGFDRAKRRAGVCKYGPKRISLSVSYVMNNPLDCIKDTILHEIAHALCGPGKGHGREWKLMCIRIGAKPQRCYDSSVVVMPAGKWKSQCGGCAKVFTRHRRPKYQYWCKACGCEKGMLLYTRS